MRAGIAGAGGHGRDVAEILNAARWELVGWYDDDPARHLPGPEQAIQAGVDLILAVNDPQDRWRLWRRLHEAFPLVHKSAPALFHPSAVLGRPLSYEPGVVVAAGAVVTTGVHLGAHTHVNVCASISQGSWVGNFCTIGPGARVCGDVQVGNRVFIGAGAVVANTAQVEDDAVVGAGAVVLPGRVVRRATTVAGVPAQAISTRHRTAS